MYYCVWMASVAHSIISQWRRQQNTFYSPPPLPHIFNSYWNPMELRLATLKSVVKQLNRNMEKSNARIWFIWRERGGMSWIAFVYMSRYVSEWYGMGGKGSPNGPVLEPCNWSLILTTFVANIITWLLFLWSLSLLVEHMWNGWKKAYKRKIFCLSKRRKKFSLISITL